MSRNRPQVRICSPIIHDGHVYWAWRQARCLDFATGEQRWEGGDFGDAGSCIITADDRLIIFGRQGKLSLVNTAARSSGQYQPLAENDGLFATDVWPHVVLADSRLYLKDRLGNLKCYELRGKR